MDVVEYTTGSTVNKYNVEGMGRDVGVGIYHAPHVMKDRVFCVISCVALHVITRHALGSKGRDWGRDRTTLAKTATPGPHVTVAFAYIHRPSWRGKRGKGGEGRLGVSGAQWGSAVLVVPRGEGAAREATPTALRWFPALPVPPPPINGCACVR